MKQKGSITVFLSLVLLLLFSFILTTLEAARIRGASAYVSMVSELAGESFLASYYYPLFQEYRLFGVDAGDGEGYLSEHRIVDGLKEDVDCGLEDMADGLLDYKNTGVLLNRYETLMTGEGTEFLSQVREQTVLDGLSLALSELFSEELFTEAGAVGEVYLEQEKALAATATVTRELLSLMEVSDGVAMGKHGLQLDKNGRVKPAGTFIKKLLPMTAEELKAAYGTEEIYNAVAGSFYRADETAKQVKELVEEAIQLKEDIKLLELALEEYAASRSQMEATLAALEAEKQPDEQAIAMVRNIISGIDFAIESATRQKNEYEQRKKNVIKAAEPQYKSLKSVLKSVEPVLEKGLDILDDLEEKQIEARSSVVAYEAFLKSMESVLSDELYGVFAEELQNMKLYVGLEEQGYYVPVMRQSVSHDLALLQSFSLEGFSEEALERVRGEMEAVEGGMKSYTANGLWFEYGEIVVAEQNGADIAGVLAELLFTGVLNLVGVPKEKQSDRSVSGVALPSAVLEDESFLTELMACIQDVIRLFRGGEIGTLLQNAGNALLDTTALELYSMKYFHCFTEQSPYTQLKYEREYLLFGDEDDKSNLLYMVLHLIAIRTLLSMVSILKQPDKMAQMEGFAAGVAGFTGIPALLAIIKYAILLLWSVEEALVEVAALLLGKRIAVIGTGTISFGELLFFNKTVIAKKAKAMPEGVGAEYEDYLSLLTLTRTTRKRMYRAMDLIQENIRLRYRDHFRMRNVVTKIEFHTKTELEELFDTGVFLPPAYQMEWKEESAY
ncbi:MAG: hypothetical protein J6K04_13275 [Lachnospiraceae bacterium]|nr:hypothetical protein [Lachnospiraceae bacterium]